VTGFLHNGSVRRRATVVSCLFLAAAIAVALADLRRQNRATQRPPATATAAR
jgi:hypothetical protein